MKRVKTSERRANRGIAALAVGLAVGLTLLAGCVGPETRIRRNQAVFDQLAPEAQALIREGRVALGFTPEMVKLAVGEPDRRWTRTDALGQTEIWTFTTFETEAGEPLYRGWYHYGLGGYPYLENGRGRTAKAREYFKVSFVAGRVSAVEQIAR